MDFLYCVYAYGQNYEKKHKENEEDEDDEDSDDDLDEEDIEAKYNTFTFDFLFKKILEYCEDQSTIRIKAVANWKIKSSENIL